MFQFPAFAPFPLCVRVRVTISGWVSPFGYLRINAYSQLPTAFRSVSRPSSPLIAKASTKCSYHSLDSFSCINNLYTLFSKLSKIYPFIFPNKGILYFLLRFFLSLFTLFYNYPFRCFFGGGKEVRTPDPLLAKQVLSQLSYTPDLIGGSGKT